METARKQNEDLNEKGTPVGSLKLDSKENNSNANNKATSYLHDLDITEDDTDSNSSFGEFDSQSFWDNDSTSNESSSIKNNQKTVLVGDSLSNVDSKDLSGSFKIDKKQNCYNETENRIKLSDHEVSVSSKSTDNSKISNSSEENDNKSSVQEKNETLKLNLKVTKQELCRSKKENLDCQLIEEKRLSEVNITDDFTVNNIQNVKLESKNNNDISKTFESLNCFSEKSGTSCSKENIVNDNTDLKCESQLSNEKDFSSIKTAEKNIKLKENQTDGTISCLDENTRSLKNTSGDNSAQVGEFYPNKSEDNSYLHEQQPFKEIVNGESNIENESAKKESDIFSTKITNEVNDSFVADETKFQDLNDGNDNNINTEFRKSVVESNTNNKEEEFTDLNKNNFIENNEFANLVDENLLRNDSFADFGDENVSKNDEFGNFSDEVKSEDNKLESFHENENSFGNFSNAGSDQFGEITTNGDDFGDFDDKFFSENDEFGKFSNGVKSENNDLENVHENENSFGNFSDADSDQFGDFDTNGDDFEDTNFEKLKDTKISFEKYSEFSNTNKLKERNFSLWFSSANLTQVDKENTDPLLIMSYLNSRTLFKDSKNTNNRPETIWNLLKDIDTAVALKFKYEGCKLHRNMLNELKLNSDNIVYQGSTKPYVVPTYFAASLQSMDSSVLKPVSAAQIITANDDKLRKDSSNQKSNEQKKWTTETACSELPPSVITNVVSSTEKDCDNIEKTTSSQQIEFNFDCFSVDDVKNNESNKDQDKDQDKLDPDLLQLAQLPSVSKVEKSPGQDKISKLLATIKSTRKEDVVTGNAEEELSAEVREHLGKFPDISYMRSSVLIFPSEKNGSN